MSAATTSPPTAQGPLPRGRTPMLRGIVAQARLQLVLMMRSPESFLVTLGLPTGLLLFLGTVDLLPTAGDDPVAFLVPGVMAVSIMATGLVAAAIQTAFERQYGVLKLLGGTPMPRWGFVLAKAAGVAVLLAIQLVLIVAIAVGLLDWSPTVGVGAAALGMLVGAITFTAMGQALAGALPAMLCLAATNGLFVVLAATGGLLFDPDRMPTAVTGFGEALPAGALGNVLRAAFDAQPSLDVGALAVVGAWGVVALLVTARTFRWESTR